MPLELVFRLPVSSCKYNYNTVTNRRNFFNCHLPPDASGYYKYDYEQKTNTINKITKYSDESLSGKLNTTSYIYEANGEMREEFTDHTESTESTSRSHYTRQEIARLKKGFAETQTTFIIESIDVDYDGSVDHENIREYNIYGRLHKYYYNVQKNNSNNGNILSIGSNDIQDFSYDYFAEYVYEDANCTEKESATYSAIPNLSYLAQVTGTRLCYESEGVQ